MNYYIRHNNRTLGPFPEQTVLNLLQRGGYDASVRLSTDMNTWYPPCELSAFRSVQLPTAPVAQTGGGVPMQSSPKNGTQKTVSGKDHIALHFMAFCAVLFLGFIGIVWAISGEEPGEEGSPPTKPITPESLPQVYQEKQRAVGLVVFTFSNRKGVTETVPLGTAFAIDNNKFVTNAHVAYAVKSGFEDYLVKPLLRRSFAEEAKKRNMTIEAYLDDIGARGIERARTELIAFWKGIGVTVRDIEVRLNHSNGKTLRIARVQVPRNYNPGGKKSGEYDIAVLETVETTDCYFDVATKEELHALCAGTPVASAGFPMEGLKNDLNLEKPEASYSTGDIKKVTDFDNKDGGPENNRSVFHSIPSAGGSSGSPIFTSNGKVVAVLWGIATQGELGGVRISSSAMQNYAVRIDQLETLGEPVEWKDWVYDPTKDE